MPPQHDIKSTCKVCGWSTVTIQRSDVMRFPSTCKNCGSEDIAISFVDKPKFLSNNLRLLFSKLLGKI